MLIRLVGTGAILSKRNSACTLIDDEVLVDCGSGIFKALRQQQVNLKKLSTVLITHFHGDHYADLPCLILYRYLSDGEKERLVVYGPKGLVEKVKSLFIYYYPDTNFEDAVRDSRIELVEFDTLDNRRIEGDYFINAFSVIHAKTLAYGYSIEKGGKVVVCSGDAAVCDGVKKALETADLAILDMSLEKGMESHMGIDNILDIADKYKKPIIATHMRDKTRESAMKLGVGNLFVLDDGATLSI